MGDKRQLSDDELEEQDEGAAPDPYPGCQVIHETEKALKIRFPEHGDRFIPKRWVHADSELFQLDKQPDGTFPVGTLKMKSYASLKFLADIQKAKKLTEAAHRESERRQGQVRR